PAPAPGPTGAAPLFSAYKDTSINLNFNTSVVSTRLTGGLAPVVDDMTAQGASPITLAFATGECGSESWAGVSGATMASANVPLLNKAGIKYIVSTGGAAGSFSCGSEAGMTTFINRW